MINAELKFPFYAKATLLLIGLFVLFSILYIIQAIVVPLLFAMIFAILLNPVVNFLERHHINRIVAILSAMTLAFLIIAAIVIPLASQVTKFSDSWPTLEEKINGITTQVISWSESHFNIKPQNIHNWIIKAKSSLSKSSGVIIGKTLLGIGSLMMVLVLIPIYIFLLLYYKALLLKFIHRLFGQKHQKKVSEITFQTEIIIQHYLMGLLIEAFIVATLNSIGLLILGIDFAIMLGIIGAILNVIPYIGGLIAVALPMIIAIATKSSPIYAVYVLVIYYLIQFIDNHFIVPVIVASKVKINALFSIIVVLAGNALWGIPGMFLSLPLLAIIKLIFDHIEPMKPWGFLLGDGLPEEERSSFDK